MAGLWELLTLLIIASQHGRVAGSCPDGWIDCLNGECVALIWQCDGENDCGNNEDERNCESGVPPVTCTDSQFQCVGDGSCVPKSWRCDGHNDCVDNSDEIDCANLPNCNGFRCRNNVCIPSKWKCDGNSDCSDNSDEESCPNAGSKLCSPSEFPCGSGTCLDNSKVCDGKKDCPDGSDEGIHCGDKCSNATCSQKCRSTPTGPECYCDDGYMLSDKDNKTCSDINECSTDGFCSQSCMNLLGSYKCSCVDGYDLINNTCEASGVEPVLVFSTLDDIRAMRLRSKQYFPVHKAIVKAAAVDADPLRSRVFWVEISNRSAVYSSNMDGSKMETVLQTGLMVPEGIAVDYLGQNLYFTDSGLRQILVCRMDGSMCHVLHDTNIGSPRAITLDVSEGLMYWSDWGNETAGIYRSGMDGSRRVSLVSKDIRWPNGIAVDHTTERLYWTDALLATIEYISLDGSSRKVLLQDDTFHPYSLAVFEDNLYWSDWNSFSLDTCNKFTGHRFGVLVREKKHIMGVHVYHPVLARRTNNPCWNHPCSHICLLAPLNGYTCACPPGFKLSANGKTCQIDTSFPMLWVNDEESIYHVRPRSVGSMSVDEVPVTSVDHIGRMAYDWNGKTLFVADTRAPAIFSVSVNTLVRKELVRNHLIMPVDLAYDWLNGNLYWVDSSKGTVEVVTTATARTTIIVVDLSKPSAIALMPATGRMFVSTIGDDKFVAMYDMDGKNKKELPSLSGVVTSLAVHPTLNFLFMGDQRSERISVIDYSSPNSKPEIKQSRIGSVLSLAVDDKYVYWTESSRQALNYANQNKTFTHSILLPGQNGLASRKVVYAAEPPKHLIGHGNCEGNGGCSYMCLGSPVGKTCICQTGMKLSSDGRNCTLKECASHEFTCVKSKVCIPKEFVCDGVPDCDDQSDEKCREKEAEPICPIADFMCRNGKCILASWKCDRHDDCGDGSDEVGCPPPAECGKGQFQCRNGECVNPIYRCDGEDDCQDNSDETGCDATTCDPATQMRCDHGQCVPKSWACDGAKDCYDGSDERNCSIAKTCSPQEFTCGDGVCIDKVLVCDQRLDCSDGSDEKNCTVKSCKDGKYQCADRNTCLYIHEVCDQIKDCPDGDDEVNCTRTATECTREEFFCTSNSRCIPISWLCDGGEDCTDGADEKDCIKPSPKPTSPPSPRNLPCDEFTCAFSGECLPHSRVCDGTPDCHDLSDEGASCSLRCQHCGQLCHLTPQGPRCGCNAGYALDPADNVTCLDVDECLRPGSCSQLCTNTKGGFSCSCLEGYFLDRRTRCKADGGPAALAYLLHDQIRGVELGSKAQKVYLDREGADMRGMDFDAERGVFFWTDWKESTINIFNPVNNLQEVLLRTPVRPRYIRWDWLAKNVYYSDDDPRINVCSGDGKFCATLDQPGEVDGLSGFDVSPAKGFLFFSVWGHIDDHLNGLIGRVELDGTGQRTLVREGLVWPSDVSVDHAADRIYWVDSKINVMESTDFEGGDRKVVVADGMFYPFSVVVFEDFVYWSNWGSDSIIMCDKHTGRDCERLHKTNAKSKVLMIVHKANQPRGDNLCETHKCPQLCLPKVPGGHTCRCDRNFENATCLPKQVTSATASTTPLPTECLQCERHGALCVESDGKYLCQCPEGYTGDKCDVRMAATTQDKQYDYGWIVGAVSAVIFVAIIVGIAVYCRLIRDKLSRVKENVAVTFRGGASSRKSGRLIVETDEGDEFGNLWKRAHSGTAHDPEFRKLEV